MKIEIGYLTKYIPEAREHFSPSENGHQSLLLVFASLNAYWLLRRLQKKAWNSSVLLHALRICAINMAEVERRNFSRGDLDDGQYMENGIASFAIIKSMYEKRGHTDTASIREIGTDSECNTILEIIAIM